MIIHFRYATNGEQGDENFVIRNLLSKETLSWFKVNDYPAEEFLTSESLSEHTLDKCGEYALRWLLESDDLKHADFLMIATPYGVRGLLVIKSDDNDYKTHFYDDWPTIGVLRGTPYTIKRFNAL